MIYLALFMLLGMFWFISWLEYSSNFVVIVSASTYYFSSNAEIEGNADISLGIQLAHIQHTGSIAFGALIIAIVKVIRVIFYDISIKLSEMSGDNKLVGCIASCGNCCLGCIEKIVDYINTSAFSYMAITGESFCTSAWNCFLLNVKHLAKFAFANFIATIFIFLGKVAITAANCYTLYLLIKADPNTTNETSVLSPMILIAVLTFCTANIFLGFFDKAVLALMTSLAVDMDMNDGTPVFGPPTFHESISKISSKVDESEDNNFKPAPPANDIV